MYIAKSNNMLSLKFEIQYDFFFNRSIFNHIFSNSYGPIKPELQATQPGGLSLDNPCSMEFSLVGHWVWGFYYGILPQISQPCFYGVSGNQIKID